jgi:hypothetical protein
LQRKAREHRELLIE